MGTEEQKVAKYNPCCCMSEFEKNIVEKQVFTEFKTKVLEANFNKALIFEKSGAIHYRPILEVELKIEGRKQTLRRGVIYNYCPFCGKPFEKPDTIVLAADQEEILS
jgi:hypothetical protein